MFGRGSCVEFCSKLFCFKKIKYFKILHRRRLIAQSNCSDRVPNRQLF